MCNRREYPGLRAHIDQMLAHGWRFVSRCPLRLECAGEVMEVREGVMSNG